MTSDRFSAETEGLGKVDKTDPDSSPLSSSLKREQEDSLAHFTEPANRPEGLAEVNAPEHTGEI